MNSSQEQRKKILNELKDLFVKAHERDKGITREKLTQYILLNYGATLRKAKEYIETLKTINLITEDKEGLWLK